jgi:nucleotide exchange factor SIL1
LTPRHRFGVVAHKFQFSEIMSRGSLLVYVLLLMLCSGAFVPSDEWQRVPEGESLPPGVHVRVNMQTGYKEAKWIQKEQQEQGIVVQQQQQPEKEPEPEYKANNLTAEEWEQVLVALGMKAEDPFQVFRNNIEIIRNKTYQSREQLEDNLIDVDEALRDVDISKTFIDNGGIPIFNELINEFHDDLDLISHVYSAIGSSAQNNQHSACALSKSGLFENCLQRFHQSVEQQEMHNRLPSRALYCISSIVRSCSDAKESYFRDYSEFFQDLRHVLSSTDEKFLKVQRQTIDLIRTIVENYFLQDASQLSSYFHYESTLLSDDWCRHMGNLIKSTSDLHIIENSLSVLATARTRNYCTNSWSSHEKDNFIAHVRDVITKNMLLDEESKNDPYLSEMQSLLNSFE